MRFMRQPLVTGRSIPTDLNRCGERRGSTPYQRNEKNGRRAVEGHLPQGEKTEGNPRLSLGPFVPDRVLHAARNKPAAIKNVQHLTLDRRHRILHLNLSRTRMSLVPGGLGVRHLLLRVALRPLCQVGETDEAPAHSPVRTRSLRSRSASSHHPIKIQRRSSGLAPPPYANRHSQSEAPAYDPPPAPDALHPRPAIVLGVTAFFGGVSCAVADWSAGHATSWLLTVASAVNMPDGPRSAMP